MEDVLKFLVIIAAIAIGIAQQYKKEAKKKASATPHPHPAAETETVERNETPRRSIIPENEPFIPRHSQPVHTAHRPEPSKRTTTPAPPAKAAPAVEDNGPEYTIRSAEEARRAIVWGEILKRKYE